MKNLKLLKIAILILISIFISQTILTAQGNPFAPKKNKTQKVKKIRKIHYPVFIQRIFDKINPIQRQLNKKLAELTQQIKKEKSKKALFLILLFSFLYGLIHGLGPGHGKTITFSYFLSKQGDIKKGFLMGILMAFMHAGSALIVVLVLYFIIKKAFLASFDDISYYIKLISYSLIIVIGLIMLIKAFMNLKKENKLDVGNNKAASRKVMLSLILVVGMVPCPGAVIILLFSFSMKMIGVGIVSVFFMALGMAAAISLIGIATITTKKGLLRLASGQNQSIEIFQFIMEITGSLLIIILGGFFLLVSL